jgi:hypothetical protein
VYHPILKGEWSRRRLLLATRAALGISRGALAVARGAGPVVDAHAKLVRAAAASRLPISGGQNTLLRRIVGDWQRSSARRYFSY